MLGAEEFSEDRLPWLGRSFGGLPIAAGKGVIHGGGAVAMGVGHGIGHVGGFAGRKIGLVKKWCVVYNTTST